MDMCCDGNAWFSCEILWVVRLVSSGMVIIIWMMVNGLSYFSLS
jgi:hypothetical protein